MVGGIGGLGGFIWPLFLSAFGDVIK